MKLSGSGLSVALFAAAAVVSCGSNVEDGDAHRDFDYASGGSRGTDGSTSEAGGSTEGLDCGLPHSGVNMPAFCEARPDDCVPYWERPCESAKAEHGCGYVTLTYVEADGFTTRYVYDEQSGRILGYGRHRGCDFSAAIDVQNPPQVCPSATPTACESLHPPE